MSLLNIECLPLPALVHCRDGTVVEGNELMAVLFRSSGVGFVGENVDDLLGTTYRQTLQEWKADDNVLGFKMVLNVEGSRIDYLVNVRRKVVPDTDQTRFFATFSNIIGGKQFSIHNDDRDLMEMQLRQAQKLEAIGQLAAGISHEINTPIQFVRDNLKFLEQSFEDYQDYISFLESAYLKLGGLPESLAKKSDELELGFLKDEIPTAISESFEGSSRVRDIVKAMKEFSHSGTGEIEFVNINEAIEVTVAVIRNEWKSVSDIEMELGEGLPMVPVDVGPFKQTVLNLIVNAAHAIEERVNEGKYGKGKIDISTYQTGDHVVLKVADTGGGIPEEIANRIYEPFFTTKEVGKGTGQGLAIAYDVVVRKLKGKLYYESEKGQGTCFFIELPVSLKR